MSDKKAPREFMYIGVYNNEFMIVDKLPSCDGEKMKFIEKDAFEEMKERAEKAEAGILFHSKAHDTVDEICSKLELRIEKLRAALEFYKDINWFIARRALAIDDKTRGEK